MIKENFVNLPGSILASMPSNKNLDIPSHNTIVDFQARTALIAYFQNLIERVKSQKTAEGVFFGALLAARADPEGRKELKDLDDHTLAENMFVLNFAAFDTTSINLVWILKLLLDHPDVFRRIQVRSTLNLFLGLHPSDS